jgi:hypothetical protein
VITVTGVRAGAEADGSHTIELSGGLIAVIPRDQVHLVAMTLQKAVAQRVFAQGRRLDIPTESTLALAELRLEDAAPAMVDGVTNLACNLRGCGWVAFLCEDDVLRNLKAAVEKVLLARVSASRAN